MHAICVSPINSIGDYVNLIPKNVTKLLSNSRTKGVKDTASNNDDNKKNALYGKSVETKSQEDMMAFI